MSYSTNILLNDFAIRSFRNTADQDYIHARLAYRAGLIPQFQWSSLHCLEKYGKCILLLNRINGKGIKHEVIKSVDLINKHAPFKIDLSEQANQFISRLETGARFRYLEASWYNLEHDIIRLDETVSLLRRYCQPLNYTIKINPNEEFNFLQVNLEKIQRARLKNPRDTCIQSGMLEKILANKKERSRDALVWNNLYFGSSKRRSVRMRSFWKSENSPLYLHPEILDEVTKYVFLPKEVIDAYKNG